MVNIFVVRHKQPKDLPFMKSASAKQIKDKKYMNTLKITRIVILICMSTLYYGLCLSMISAINSNILRKYFGQIAGQTSTFGWLVGLFPIGAAVGALISGIFIKYFTRRQIILIFDIVAIITTGLLQIPNIGLLLALRIVQGIVVGVFMAVVGMYINQIVPIDLHGSQGVISQILIVFGVVLDYIIKVAFTASNANDQAFWRFAFAITGLPVIIQFICICLGLIPQSPMSLIQRDKIDQAKAILAQFNIPQVLNDVVAEMVHDSKKAQMKKIAKSHGVSRQQSQNKIQAASDRRADSAMSSLKDLIKQEEKPDPQTTRVLSSILQMYGKHKTMQPEIHKILSQHHMQVQPVPHIEPKVPIKAIILGFQLHFMQQFSGTKMVVTECGVIFNNLNPTLSLYTPLVANIVQLAAVFVSVPVLSRYGRKNPTLIGQVVLCIINFTIGALFLASFITGNTGCVYAAAVFILFFMIAYSLSLGPVVWPYVPEIMPSKYIPYASCMNWVAAAICTIATPYILNAVGSPYPVFLFFGGIMIVFFIINWFILIETKGLTPSQIAAKLSK